LIEAFAREFTYAFGGCSVLHGLDGRYRSRIGTIVPDRINLINTDTPFSFAENFPQISRFADELRDAAFEALEEEAVLVAAYSVYHAG
jgi:hypothetical protein